MLTFAKKCWTNLLTQSQNYYKSKRNANQNEQTEQKMLNKNFQNIRFSAIKNAEQYNLFRNRRFLSSNRNFFCSIQNRCEFENKILHKRGLFVCHIHTRSANFNAFHLEKSLWTHKRLDYCHNERRSDWN